MDAFDSTYDDSILLVQKVTRAFYWTAEKLDDNREKIRNTRIACGVAVGVGVGASVVAAAATGGLSVLLGGAAISGIALAIFMALTFIANDILDHKDIRGLESQWKALKVDFLRDKDIPQENRADLERWARQNLSDKEKKAVLEALDKSITESRSTKRLEKLKDDDTQTLLESLLFLVLADFSAFEILVGAMRRKNERPGAAIRRIALQMDGYRDDLLEAKARKLERRCLMEVSVLRLKQEEDELTKSIHEQLLGHDNRPDQEESNLLSPLEDKDDEEEEEEEREEEEREEEEREDGEDCDEGREPLPVLPRTQKQKRMDKEKQWRKSVEESQLQAHLDEELEQERRLIEIEQRQRRLAKREHWQRCMAEEKERKMREAEQQKQAWRQAEQDLMDKEEEDQTKRLLSLQMEDIHQQTTPKEKDEDGKGEEEQSVFNIL